MIDRDHLRTVCKMGQGNDCCRYIVADAQGICCAKLEPALASQIDRRVAIGAFTAISDNCPGKPMGAEHVH